MNKDNESKDLTTEEIINKYDKISTDVTDDDEQINVTLEDLKKPKRITKIIYRTVTGLIILLVIIISIMALNKDFAVYASNVPGLNLVINAIYGDLKNSDLKNGKSKYGDLGIAKAIENGYYVINEKVYEKDNFVLKLSNIVVDEDRIVFDSRVKNNNKNIEEVKYYNLKFEGELQEHCVIGGSLENNNTQKIEIDLKNNKVLDDSIVKKLLNNNKDLNLSCKIYGNTDVNPRSINNKTNDTVEPIKLCTIENIIIPINKNTVSLSKQYQVEGETILLDKANVTIENLIVAPTRMTLLVHHTLNEQIQSFGLRDIYLEDEKGNKYKSESSHYYNAYKNDPVIEYLFVPSLYYEKDITKLSLHYNKYEYMYNDEYNKITINKNDLPKKIQYFNKNFEFSKMIYENGSLWTERKYIESDDFNMGDMDLLINDKIVGNAGFYSCQYTDNEVTYEQTFDNVPEQDEYTFILNPTFREDCDGEIELKFKKNEDELKIKNIKTEIIEREYL